jgi:hypothetical protein
MSQPLLYPHLDLCLLSPIFLHHAGRKLLIQLRLLSTLFPSEILYTLLAITFEVYLNGSAYKDAPPV